MSLIHTEIASLDHLEREENASTPINYKFVKRAPQRPFGRNADFFVSSNTRVVVGIKKAQKQLEKDPSSPLIIHGLGSAISKAVDIANALVQLHSGTMAISVATSTIPLVDDYEPLVPDLPPISQIRLTSAIHITLTPTALSSKASH